MEIKKLIASVLLVLVALPAVFADQSQGATTTCGSQKYIGPNDVPEPEIVPTCYPYRPRIDVVFVIDSTGSMADEIRSVKTHIVKIVKEVQNGNPRPDIRVGLVTYRDHKPEEYEYLYRRFSLTRDIDEALRNIERIRASGGGDYPEAVADGLHAALHNMNWDPNAKKIVFLIGDAAPHGVGAQDYSFKQGCPNGHHFKDEIKTAKEEGIKIYTISGSGMDPIGIEIWKDIAEMTGGEYQRLKYERQDVDQYYREEGVDEVWATAAKQDADYDRSTNTILTNTFGRVAKAAMVQEAEAIGVSYDDDYEEDNDEPVVNIDDIIEPRPGIIEPKLNATIQEFFRSVFDKIIFWR
ncbi:VWA domain-containing protein [Candidatus Woesearchaeota archaeon]|nr:VWA domain-containing protein [Candidatus Woesearchaeota archaeon]